MTKRRHMIVLAIVVLVLLLGVGYATVSSVNLIIDGTAKAETKALEVYFDGVNSGTDDNVKAISSPDKTRSATFTVEDMKLNQTVTMTFEIKNYETDLAATLVEPVITNSNETYFLVTSSLDKTSLAALGTATVTVNVKLIKTPVTTEQESATVNVTIAANPVA